MFYQLFHKSQREEGQGLVEYSLLITLVALAVTTILLILGDTIE
jgi:Flp pilus assembly pilin Flp